MVRNPSGQAKQRSNTLGFLAEALVAQWLSQQGWQILQHRWHCRWGELDLVALFNQGSSLLTFVEVKARSRGSWDANGLLSLTSQKRLKLQQAAHVFLSEASHLAELPCRFDVALVRGQLSRSADLAQVGSTLDGNSWPYETFVELGKPVTLNPYRLTLQHYIPNAFDEV